MSGLLQVLGALIILCAFVAVQSGRVQPSSRTPLSMNLVGSALLAAVALSGRQWGFLLLEGAWAAVSAVSLARRPSAGSGEGMRRRPAQGYPGRAGGS
jgi:hypothetical protein